MRDASCEQDPVSGRLRGAWYPCSEMTHSAAYWVVLDPRVSWKAVFREPGRLCQLDLWLEVVAGVVWVGVVAGVVTLPGHQLCETLRSLFSWGLSFPAIES